MGAGRGIIEAITTEEARIERRGSTIGRIQQVSHLVSKIDLPHTAAQSVRLERTQARCEGKARSVFQVAMRKSDVRLFDSASERGDDRV